jgi:hypothetical protein
LRDDVAGGARLSRHKLSLAFEAPDRRAPKARDAEERTQ